MGIEVGKTVLIDTNCFIYYFENNEEYADKIEKVFWGIQNGDYKAFTSVLTVSEILVKPYKEKNMFLTSRYKLILSNYPNLIIVVVDFEIADIAAKLRSEHGIKTPDAIILATCIKYKVDYLISNDIRLKKVCDIEGIEMLDFDNL